MPVIDFDQTPREAFAQGFLKGLGAPAVLFGCFEMPDMPEIKPLEMPTRQDQEALAEDWRKVGMGIRTAMSAYEQDHQAQAT